MSGVVVSILVSRVRKISAKRMRAFWHRNYVRRTFSKEFGCRKRIAAKFLLPFVDFVRFCYYTQKKSITLRFPCPRVILTLAGYLFPPSTFCNTYPSFNVSVNIRCWDLMCIRRNSLLGLSSYNKQFILLTLFFTMASKKRYFRLFSESSTNT